MSSLGFRVASANLADSSRLLFDDLDMIRDSFNDVIMSRSAFVDSGFKDVQRDPCAGAGCSISARATVFAWRRSICRGGARRHVAAFAAHGYSRTPGSGMENYGARVVKA